MRQTRSAMLGALSADYVRTARSKGLSEHQVVGAHALRNSLTTVVTVLGLQLGALISGAVVTEQIFVIPGFGKLIVDAVLTRNYPVIQARRAGHGRRLRRWSTCWSTSPTRCSTRGSGWREAS